MSDKVLADQIEGIVGRRRDSDRHYGRAVSDEEVFYILHSDRCLRKYQDLRDCPFSLAMDNRLSFSVEDEVLILHVKDGTLYGRRA